MSIELVWSGVVAFERTWGGVLGWVMFLVGFLRSAFRRQSFFIDFAVGRFHVGLDIEKFYLFDPNKDNAKRIQTVLYIYSL